MSDLYDLLDEEARAEAHLRYLEAEALRRCRSGQHGEEDLFALVNYKGVVTAMEKRCMDCDKVLGYLSEDEF